MIQLNIRIELKLLVVVVGELVMHVADAHEELGLVLRFEPGNVEVARAVGRVELHVLGQTQAEVFGEEFFVGAHEGNIIARPVHGLALVVVVGVGVLDLLLPRIKVRSYWQQLALADVGPEVFENLLEYLRLLVPVLVEAEDAQDLLIC